MNVIQFTELLLEAAGRGNDTHVKDLIPHSYSFYDDGRSLIVAAENGHVECVRLLVSFSDPQNYFLALYKAASNGHAQCVEELINHCNPSENNSSALQIAAGLGHTECVKLLIPVSDPTANDSVALQAACEYAHYGVIDALFEVSDVQAVLERLHKKHSDRPACWQYLEEKISQRQKQLLNNKLNDVVATKHSSYRKM